MIVRSCAFLAVCFLAVVDNTFFVAALLAYGMLYQGAELLLPALAVDSFFGLGTLVPYYTITAAVFLVVRHWLITYSLFYTEP